MPASSPDINAGILDRRVTLLRPIYNAPEDEITDWEVVGDVWACVAPAAAPETNEAGRMVSTAQVPIIIRYRADIDARWRVRDREQQYEVRTRIDVARRHVQLQLNCEEVL